MISLEKNKLYKMINHRIDWYASSRNKCCNYCSL